MNKTKLGISATVIIVILLIWQPWSFIFQKNPTTTVISSEFETTISVTGELKAEKAVDIMVPEVSFNEEVDIWAMKILSLVEEGKIVKKGDEIAQLEPTEVEENLNSVNDRLNEQYTIVEDAKIDSSLALSAQRESIEKVRDRLLDANIKVEQSSYESKAVQRQATIELDKAKRALSKAQRDLITKTQKHKSKIARGQRRVDRYEYKKALLEQLRSELIVKSPADGMVIYGNGYSSQKIKVGSRVGRWSPLIATLPDLSTLISEMHVKEIDIAKIKVGQVVKIKIDAFPKVAFDGTIISIANIGQEIPGEFQNGFKVKVELLDYKETLLPGMTTNNSIITNRIETTLMVDKSAIFNQDSINYVIKKDGFKLIKQEVKLGLENDKFFQVTKGLMENDKVLSHLPDNADKLEIIKL
ncbi:efflux RND transporter periplasmic adaptor subunit [Carboxylicivirga sp. M1479]|uniref:efflux RND transporter periplasmic adaptor subunit n=1 Tax=Carboxylicivirga sp. M1479 TaxID=2594476 RepID=UPI001178574E|nr:HlyD family efflux transporter periplasmic adaptor subunit [Carboxylicivirga sp. M1479]TRX71902.1 HlyD family efflux transporter periplasmic adaptor subunit [Carboxylicivirga sp. M1479]